MNKKLSLSLILLATAFNTVAQEKNVVEFPRTFLKVSPHFLKDAIELGVERMNSSFSKSFQVAVGYRNEDLNWHGWPEGYGYLEGTGAHVDLAYRKYIVPFTLEPQTLYGGIYYSLSLNGSTFKGTWVGFFYNEETGDVTETHPVKVFSVTPSFTMGFQHQIWKTFAIDVFLGGGMRFASLHSMENVQRWDFPFSTSDPAYSGICLKAGVNVCFGL